MIHAGIDRELVLILSHELMDGGDWFEDLHLAIGSPSQERENIERLFAGLCDYYKVRQMDRDAVKNLAIHHYCSRISADRSDPEMVMAHVRNLVEFVQQDLKYEGQDSKVVGDASGIEEFIGPYWEYSEVDYYELHRDKIDQIKKDMIDSIVGVAEKLLKELT